MSILFLDMDGVVADWDSAASKLIGYSVPSGTLYPSTEWAKILDNPRFYRNLPLMRDAQILVNGVKEFCKDNNYDLIFLTAVPRGNDMPWAFYDKMLWAREYFPDIPVWFGPYSVDKQIRSEIGNILIDDRISNIREWNAAGGIGLLHRGNVQETLDALNFTTTI